MEEEDLTAVRILLLGEPGSGKSAIMHRYTNGSFLNHYSKTYGANFASNDINYDPKTTINITMWEVGGQERSGHSTKRYYQECNSAFIVFDWSKPKALEEVLWWKQDLDKKLTTGAGKPVPVMLLANKYDAVMTGCAKAVELDNFVQQHNFIGWKYTSAKDKTNLDEALKMLLAETLYSMDLRSRPKPTEPDNDALRSPKYLPLRLEEPYVSLYDSFIENSAGAKAPLYTPLVKLRLPCLLDEKVRQSLSGVSGESLNRISRFVHQGSCQFEDTDFHVVFELMENVTLLEEQEMQQQIWTWISDKIAENGARRAKEPNSAIWDVLAAAVAHNNEVVKALVFNYIACWRKELFSDGAVKMCRMRVPDLALDLAEFLEANPTGDKDFKAPLGDANPKRFEDHMRKLFALRNETGDCEIVVLGENKNENEKEKEREKEKEKQKENSSRVKAHKLVLASHNEYFKNILFTTPAADVIELPRESGLTLSALETLLEYIYLGDADVSIEASTARILLGASEFVCITERTDPSRVTFHESFLSTLRKSAAGPLTVKNCLEKCVTSWQAEQDDVIERNLAFVLENKRAVASKFAKDMAALPNPLFQCLAVQMWAAPTTATTATTPTTPTTTATTAATSEEEKERKMAYLDRIRDLAVLGITDDYEPQERMLYL